MCTVPVFVDQLVKRYSSIKMARRSHVKTGVLGRRPVVWRTVFSTREEAKKQRALAEEALRRAEQQLKAAETQAQAAEVARNEKQEALKELDALKEICQELTQQLAAAQDDATKAKGDSEGLKAKLAESEDENRRLLDQLAKAEDAKSESAEDVSVEEEAAGDKEQKSESADLEVLPALDGGFLPSAAKAE